MRRRGIALFVVANAIACGFEFPNPDRVPPEMEAPPANEPTVPPPNEPPPPPDTEPPPSTTPPSWPPEPVAPASCKAIRDAQKSQGDGLYTIDPDGSGPEEPFDVYCDMTFQGGGWTMIGRSIPAPPSEEPPPMSGTGQGMGGEHGENGGPRGSAEEAIGWTIHNGSPDDDDEPYSLDVYERPIAFDEVLVGAYDEGKRWAGAAYIVELPSRFLTDCYIFFCGVSPRTVLGDCNPSGGPTSLRWIGQTYGWGMFPIGSTGDRGLFAHGFNLSGDTCEETGNLDHLQGMIFVR